MTSATLLFCLALAGPAADPVPVYVLVIHADQHRFDCLGCMGNPDVRTPHLDALAHDGVLFHTSFCTWPVCTPSRYSLLSGQYVVQHRGRGNGATLAPGTPTFARILQSAGYRTKAVGKMHFTPAYLDVGFSKLQLAEQNGRGRLVDDYHRYLRDRGLIDSVDLIDQEQPYRGRAPADYWERFGAGPSNLLEEQHSTTWIGNRACETLEAWSDDAPSLLMVGFIKPHHPFDPPPGRWASLYDPDAMHVLPGWIDEPLGRDVDPRRGYFDNRTLTLAALRRVMAHYYATISQLDAQVGRMVDILKRKGLYDRTLIVYTADHGEFLGFHHLLLKGNHLYDPLAKVPLIVKLPGQKHAERVSNALVSSIDVTATILRAAGQKPGPDMRGRPLQPVLRGEQPERSLVFAEDGGTVMVRSATRKLIYGNRSGRSMFFDLEQDPLEMENLYEVPERRSEIQDLETALLRWFARDAQAGAYVDADAPQIDQPNVPRDRRAAEREMERYIETRMRELVGE